MEKIEEGKEEEVGALGAHNQNNNTHSRMNA